MPFPGGYGPRPLDKKPSWKDRLGYTVAWLVFKIYCVGEFIGTVLFRMFLPTMLILAAGFILSMCVYECGTHPVYTCGTVKRIGGCGSTGCRVVLEPYAMINTNRLVIEGEEYCWETDREW